MPWPKGQPRHGYVKKADREKPEEQGPRLFEADPAEYPVEDRPEVWGSKGSSAITQPCPNCSYAYADGGYCQECGWMKPIRRDPYGTNSGRRF